MNVNNIDPNQMLAEMKAMIRAAQGGGGAAAPVQPGAAGGPQGTQPGKSVDFGELLKDAISKVNDQQLEASRLSEAFAAEKPGVTLTQVMVASQKAGVAFQAMNQVRNRLVQAYQDIKNMPV